MNPDPPTPVAPPTDPDATTTGTQRMYRNQGDRRALWTMTAGHAIQHFYVAGLALTYPFVVVDFRISYGLLGVVLTIAGVIGGLLQAAAGFVRRASARSVLTLQNLGMAAASFGGAAAPGLAAFSVARVGGSVASWPQHPIGSAYLSDRFPRRRATALSWHTAGGSAGTVVVPLLVSAIIATSGWRWALVALGGALTFGALIVWVGLPGEHSQAHVPAAVTRPPVPLRQILTRRRVVAVLAASTMAAGGRGLGTLTVYIPAYLRSGLHFSPLRVGALFTIVMAASIVGPLVGGALADRLGRQQTLVVTYVTAAAAVAAFGAVGRDVLVLGAVGAAVGVLAYTESPLLQALYSELAADAQSRSAFGVFFSIAYGVGAVWTAVIGVVIDTAGFTAAFATMAGSFVAAAVILATLGRD